MATPKAAGKPARSETAETIRFLLKLALFVFVLRSFIFSPFSIPSESSPSGTTVTRAGRGHGACR